MKQQDVTENDLTNPADYQALMDMFLEAAGG